MNITSRLAAARKAADEGRIDVALAQARQAVEEAIDTSQRDTARLILASLLVEASDYARDPDELLEEARTLYESAIPGAPGDLRQIARSNLAALLLRLSSFDQAAQLFSEVEAEMSQQAELPAGARSAFLYNYGVLLERQGDLEGAFARFASAWRHDKTFREAGDAAMRLALVTKSGTEDLALVLELVATAYEQHRLWSAAEGYLKTALKHRPWLAHRDAPELAGLLIQFLGDTEIAPEVFNERWAGTMRLASNASLSKGFKDRVDDSVDAFDPGVRRLAFPAWARDPQEELAFAALLKAAGDGFQGRPGLEAVAFERYTLAGSLNPSNQEIARQIDELTRRHPALVRGSEISIREAVVRSGSCIPGLWVEGGSGGSGSALIRGCVADSDGGPLAGVEVTLISSALQKPQTTSTDANGAYHFSVPVGEYEATYAFDGFLSASQELAVRSPQVYRLNVELGPTSVAEEITVTGTYEVVSSATSYESSFIEQLPISRDVRSVVLLAPGSQSSSRTADAPTIAGSQSYDNLFLINGVVLTESIRGRSAQLFVEDAIESTTVQASKISAEYGRFTGGTLEAITKSGGNEFAGTLRDTLLGQDWEEPTPLTRARKDEVDHSLEATLGGPLWRDHIWFFGAGQDLAAQRLDNLVYSSLPIPKSVEEDRLEAKITASPAVAHRVVGSYLRHRRQEENSHFAAIDRSSLTDRHEREELFSFSYSGLYTDNFFTEVQISRREETPADGAGAKTADRIGGTWIGDLSRSVILAAPVGCGVCPSERRRQDNGLVNLRYFFSTPNSSHDLVFGYDRVEDEVRQEGHISGSDFSVWSFQPSVVRGAAIFPRFSGIGGNRLQWNPLLPQSLPPKGSSEALYVNDRGRLGSRWSLNLGLRYDRNEVNSGGKSTLAKDDAWSPRLGLTYDPQGDGKWTIDVSYGRYTAGLQDLLDPRLGASAGAAEYQWLYDGPAINLDPAAARLLSADEALAVIFSWFDTLGGVANTSYLSRVEIPGLTTLLDHRVGSPHADEFSVGLSGHLYLGYGGAGSLRVDYVHREHDNFRALRTDTTTGQVVVPGGIVADLSRIVAESEQLERTYDGLHSRFQYKARDESMVGVSWAWSHTSGRELPADRFSTRSLSEIARYPELKDFPQHNPRGDLPLDVRHKIRLWAIWNLWRTERQRISVGVLHAFDSGRPYGAVGAVDSRPFVQDLERLGYAFSPPTVAYFFTDRDAFRTDDIQHTDLTLNYSFRNEYFGQEIEIFLKPEILNLFDRAGVVAVGTTVLDATNSVFHPFDPFSDSPVEGVHWVKGDDFGRPRGEGDFQRPRMFRLSVGFRF